MPSKITQTIITILATASTSLAQLQPSPPPQTFDHYTFVIPPGYTAKKGKTFIDFLKYNEAKTAYAEITFYRARAGTSDVKAEFTNEWNTLVKKTMGVDAPAGSSSEVENGWVSTFGSAPVKTAQGKYIQTMITFVGNNLVTSISVRVTDDSFAKEIQGILESVEVEKPTANIPNK
jgi:hypothetical protein